MSGWHITSGDLKNWVTANSREAQSYLPLLMEKLVRASCGVLTTCVFPHGDAISNAGYDGRVQGATPFLNFVPDGNSVWELGIEASVNVKANDDYKKRNDDTLGVDSRTTTYVQVSPRAWAHAVNWAQEKSRQGQWQEVRAINGSMLVVWIHACPAVHRWFSQIIGKRSSHLWDADQAWEAFSARTRVPISEKFLLYARETFAVELKKAIGETPGKIVLASEDVMEPYGFLLAALKDDASFSCRLLIIENQVTWDEISQSKNALILVARGFVPTNIGFAVSNGHHCIVFMATIDAPDDALTLPRLNKSDRSKAIETLGFPEMEAYDILTDTLGYFSPLCRSRYLQPVDERRPPWADLDQSIVVPALLCFEWDDNNEHDQTVIEALSGKSYEEVSRALIDLSNKEDPFIRNVGNAWQVICRMDVWFYFKHTINRNTIDRAREKIIDVLAEVDPATDLTVEEQYLAAVKGKVRKYSPLLFRGLGNTMALLSVSHNEDIVDRVQTIAAEILDGLDTTAKWWSLGRNTRLLCEAHPEAFLTVFERQHETDPAVFVSLFNESNSAMFGDCKYAEILWSFEILAGSREYFTRAVLGLAALADIDPGTSTFANSPLSTLTKLFLGWMKTVQATRAERLVILEQVLLIRYPAIAWHVMHGALARRAITMGGSKASYRDWSLGNDRTVTPEEYRSYCCSIVGLMFNTFQSSNELSAVRLHEVLENLGVFSRVQLEQLAQHLVNIAVDEVEEALREEMADELRLFVSRHRKFSDAEWSAPEEVVSLFEQTYNHFTVDNVILKNKYLFKSHQVDLIHPELDGETSYKVKDRLVSEARSAALEEIYGAYGCDGILKFLNLLDQKQHVGQYLAEVTFSEEVEFLLLPFLSQEQSENSLVARHYVSTRLYRDDDELYRLLGEVSDEQENVKVEILLCAKVSDALFSELEKLSTDAQTRFWAKFRRTHLFEEEIQHLRIVVEGLISCNRFNAAISVIATFVKSEALSQYLGAEQIASLLCMLATESDADSDQVQSNGYELCEVIAYVQESSDVPSLLKRQIEWFFVYALQQHEFCPRFSIKALQENPAYFVELVSMVYQSKDDDVKRAEGAADVENEVSEVVKQNRWKFAHALLEEFKSLPGQAKDDIDSDALYSWVETVRELLKQTGRSEGGDQQIGQLLATSSIGTDGAWPHEAVREVIENCASDEIEVGIRMGILNSRGVVSKSIYEGGAQERALEQRYLQYAESLNMTHPRTAHLMRKLARSYSQEAKYSDNQIELRR